MFDHIQTQLFLTSISKRKHQKKFNRGIEWWPEAYSKLISGWHVLGKVSKTKTKHGSTEVNCLKILLTTNNVHMNMYLSTLHEINFQHKTKQI